MLPLLPKGVETRRKSVKIGVLVRAVGRLIAFEPMCFATLRASFTASLLLFTACSRTPSSDFPAPRLPGCAHAQRIPSEPHSDEERLRHQIEKSAATYMSRFDRFMRGELAAYEATATIEGKRSAPCAAWFARRS